MKKTLSVAALALAAGAMLATSARAQSGGAELKVPAAALPPSPPKPSYMKDEAKPAGEAKAEAPKSAGYAPGVAKPETHNGSWMWAHGPASRVDQQECLQCHSDRTSCINCHQDTEPRNHTAAWIKRTHGLEARWNRDACATCHREDSCVQCHQSTLPSTHLPGWGGAGQAVNQHCNSCHFPLSDTTCSTCHKVSHAQGQFPAAMTNALRRR